MVLKKGDFVEIDFEGKIAATGQVFDTTKEKEPVVLCVGSGMLFSKLDSSLEGKNVEDEFEIELKPEEAFGQRNPQLMQLTSVNVFREKGVNPVPGLQVNIDGVLATVRSVSGGRVTIDFNHPLAGKNLKFWVKIKRQVTETSEKIKALCADWKPSVDVKETEVTIKIDRELPEKVAELKTQKIKALIPEIKDKKVIFTSIVDKKTKA